VTILLTNNKTIFRRLELFLITFGGWHLRRLLIPFFYRMMTKSSFMVA